MNKNYRFFVTNPAGPCPITGAKPATATALKGLNNKSKIKLQQKN